MASSISGLGRSRTPKSRELPTSPITSATATRRPSRIGSGTGSAASAAMKFGGSHATDLRHVAPSAFSARWSATLHRDLAHRQALRRRGDRLAVEGDRSHDVALAWSKRLQKLARVAQRVRVLGLRRGEELLEILERLDAAPAAAAQRVDDLVSRYGVDPWRKRLPGVPGMPLEMDRQQGLLHCVLDVRVPRASARERPARHRPHRPADVLKQPPVCDLIAADRGPHHSRPRIVRSTRDGLGFHTAFVSFRLPLQFRGNILLEAPIDADVTCSSA